MPDLQTHADDRLYERIATILEEARARVARTVNTAMVHAHWMVGREIVEVEQRGKERATYGEAVVRRVAARLTRRFGAGFSLASLKRMKQFFLAFPSGSALGGATLEKGSAVLSLSARGLGRKGSTASSLSTTPGDGLFPPTLAWSHYLVLLGDIGLALASGLG